MLRLFVVGSQVSLAEAEAALAPLGVEQFVAGGVLAVDEREVSSRVAIRPLGGPANWLVAHDFARPAGASFPADHVLGMSASTMSLVGATIRSEISAAFDLGTGCGVQALHASAHSSRVVASDLNPRASACATLTMEINEITNVAVRDGNMFDPVEGERFDLVVANPPFVISPSRRYLFRDSDLAVDDVCRRLVETAPTYLADGGHCQLLASWAHVEGEDWRDRLHAWFENTGCDALVLERETLEPSAHAASWLRQTEPPDRWQPEYDEWMAYYELHRIEAVGFGLITMRRRRSGDAWFRAEQAPQDWSMPCGDHLGAVFELADLLDHHPGERLLDVALRIAPDVVLDERAQASPDGARTATRTASAGGVGRMAGDRSRAEADRRTVLGGPDRRRCRRHRRIVRRVTTARRSARGCRLGRPTSIRQTSPEPRCRCCIDWSPAGSCCRRSGEVRTSCST